jgi:hypothetical protein
MSSRPPPSVITPRDLARLRVLAEISAAGPLEFSRLIRKFARGPAFDSDTPLAPCCGRSRKMAWSGPRRGIPAVTALHCLDAASYTP